ncbi:MAG: putative Ig domain-containing protein [Deltaproteobacteria bacterium]|nr:putative Ig domain-containing protein [Deltaproteobacteria bacterium]MCL5278206.1 putative Ig domain-containing protein [Deltaproteobacteria bacterium]
MKWFALFLGALMLVAGCQKKPPVRTMFSGNTVTGQSRKRSVSIRPGNPVVGDTLAVIASEGMSVKSIAWYINGQQYAVAATLNGGFRNGDAITAVVSYTDNSGREVELASPPVVVEGALPVITSVALEPLYPTRATTMHVAVKVSDAAGAPVSFSYKWYVNNAEVDDQTGDSFSCSAYRHGDVVRVTVVPSDGEQSGKGVSSGYIAIRDAPPVIVSSPPPAFTGDTYSYQIAATDIDGDPLTYRLESKPEGMTVSREGLIRWDTKGVKSPVRATVTVVVDDGYGGSSSQTFTIDLERGKP